MIEAVPNTIGLPLTVNATVRGLALYLDNFALIKFAKGEPSRRRRMVDCLLTGRVDLMFSVTNAVDLTGPQGDSLIAIKSFLDEIGPHWFPVELDPRSAAKRELEGADPTQSCVSDDFVKTYLAYLFKSKLVDCESDTNSFDGSFSLGGVMDWLGPQRDSIRKRAEDLDSSLIRKIEEHRTQNEKNPQWLDQSFPALPFNPSKPATFTYINLVRRLVIEAKAYKLKKGDGVDFCHAVMASAFASFAALDKHWKRRIEALPKPNGLARIYYEPQLDNLVTDIEAWLKQTDAHPL